MGREPTHEARAGPGSPCALALRELARFLALRDLKLRYKQAAMGAAWSITQPLAGAVTLYVVFHTVVSLPSDGLPYLPFAMAGYAGWTLFSRNAGVATGSIVANSSLITKVYFPRLLLPVAACSRASSTSRSAWCRCSSSWRSRAWCPGRDAGHPSRSGAASLLTSLGVGLVFAALNVRYRDVRYRLPLCCSSGCS